MSILYEEISGSHNVTISRASGHTCTRLFKVPWENLAAFISLAKNSQVPTAEWMRVATIVYQQFSPDLAPVSDEQTDPSETINAYTFALVTVTYETQYRDDCAWPTDVPRPTFDEGTSLKLKIAGAGQFLTLPTRAVTTGDSSRRVAPDEKQPILIPLADYRITWDMVPDPPIAKLMGLMGHVNDAVFLGCPSEQLLFESYDVDHSFSVTKTDPRRYKVELTFKRRSVQTADGQTYGWNYRWQEKPPGWEEMKIGGVKPYPPSAFDGMFQQVVRVGSFIN